MELQVTGKGNKYVATDRNGKVLYSVRKKGFSSRYNLMDASNYYNLYTLVQTGDDKKPAFTIILNDNVFPFHGVQIPFPRPHYRGKRQGVHIRAQKQGQKGI